MALTPAQKRRLFYFLYQVGGGGNSYSKAFKARVEADGGTLESINCLNKSLQNLNL